MTGSPFEHLHPDIRHLATAELPARKACILTDRWVSYPAADDAIDRLFEMVDMPPRVRMPSILFWAHPNMGKTHIQKHFLELYAARDVGGDGTFRGAVLWLELNDGLTEKRLYLDILTALNAPAPSVGGARRHRRLENQHEGSERRGAELAVRRPAIPKALANGQQSYAPGLLGRHRRGGEASLRAPCACGVG
jgi:hypothetical protein